MSTHERTLQAGAPSAPRLGLWRTELIDTIRLATPIALTQLGQIAMMTTDLMLLGRLGTEIVAAAALAHTVLFAAFTLGMGLIAAVAPLAAQAFGARDPRGVRRALRAGLWTAVIAGVPLTAVQFWGAEILTALGQSPQSAAYAGRYLLGLSWCLIPAWIFMAIRGFMGALNRPEPALWITLAAIPSNLVLAWALIYGELGLPKLDLLGAGLATSLVNVGMCVVGLWICVTRRPFKKYNVLARFWRFDLPVFAKLLAVGLPISGAYLLEFGLFAAAALLMGTISMTALAAHQIALQVAAVLFMVPFGIAIAATVRVGHAVGRRDAAASRRAGIAALALGAAFMAVMTSLVALGRHTIPVLFLGSKTAESAPTFELTATLLLVGMFFFIADGLQTVAAGALRGLNDTRVPLMFATCSFWLVGFTASWWFGFKAGFGAVGVWFGLSIGLTLYALLLLSRFHLLTARGYMPDISHTATVLPH